MQNGNNDFKKIPKKIMSTKITPFSFGDQPMNFKEPVSVT